MIETGAPFDPLADNERVLDEEITPLLRRVVDICRERGIPYVSVIQFKGDYLCTSVVLQHGASQTLCAMAAIVYPEYFTVTGSRDDRPKVKA